MSVARCALVAVILTGTLVAATGCAVERPRADLHATSSPTEITRSWTLPDGPRLVFRDTRQGPTFGEVASVALAAPGGARAMTGFACERVYATRTTLSCMSRTGIAPVGYRETLYDAAGREIRYWPLPGPPSRTRLSPDSTLAAWTAFVDGESYAGVAFSTVTDISDVHGVDYGALATFTFLLDGAVYSATDLNFWGVTFAADDNLFYATAASGGRTWLVRGNLRGRTLVALHEGAECPSLSPDGARVAYKKNLGSVDDPRWTLAVFDLATRTERILPLTGVVDDQAEWLDDATLLFGRSAAGKTGDADIFSVPADGSAPESVFLRHAWSPSVVR